MRAREQGSGKALTPLNDPVVILGAGPAGLTAAYELVKHGAPVSVVEQDAHYVGGIARTVEHHGYRFDIGGHRFFSKSQEVEDLWTELMGDEMLTRDRLSRIYYQGRYYDYPLKALNALRNLGLLETALCLGSYAAAKVRPHPKSEDSRSLGFEPVRRAALPHLLQDVHREGMGNAVFRALG